MDLSHAEFDTDEEELWGGLDPVELPHRPLPHLHQLQSGGFHVVVRPDVLKHIRQHGATTTTNRASGILVGDVYRNDTGVYLYVEATIDELSPVSQTASDIQKRVDAQYPQWRVVGWYRAEQDIGPSLTESDLQIHHKLFNLPWQVAMLFGPSRQQDGLFLWKDGSIVRGDFLLDDDPEAPLAEERANSAAAAGSAPGAHVAADWSRGRKLSTVCLLLVISCFIFFAAMPDHWQIVRHWIGDLLSH
ncbi:MAG TPA: hypothetical protein VMD30_08555 [Tepidisphaeraceae bacterium]|nr:hypothetical protein [Tepidisphaeraceae bacterium]